MKVTDRNKNLSLKEYLNICQHYLRDIIIDLQESDNRKTHLTVEICLVYLKVAKEDSVMHSNSDNIKFLPKNSAYEIVVELFKSFL